MTPHTRELGSYPLSIGTSLAIQKFLGLDENGMPAETPEYRGLGIRTIQISLRTLLRNLLEAYPKEAIAHLDPELLADVLFGEISVIENILSPHGIPVEVYWPTHEGLASKFKMAVFRVATTDSQILYAKKTHAVLEAFEKIKPESVEVVKFSPRERPGQTAIMTHNPVELLERRFSGVLFESHTGTLKRYSKWNSKLSGKPDHIPFDRMTLQVFGDSHMFKSKDFRLKAVLLRLARNYAWTTVTTRDKIVHTIELENEPLLLDLVMELYKG